MKYEKLLIQIPQSDKDMAGCEDLLENYTGPRNIALDLGAHVGTRSLWLASDGGFKSVWAVECAMDSFNLLCKNITRNKLHDIITPVFAAVDSKERLVTLRHTGCNYGQRSIYYRENVGPRCYYVMTTKLVELIKGISEAVDFVKIDIEGTEYSLFADDNLDEIGFALYQTNCLFVETHAPNDFYFKSAWFKSMAYDPSDPNKKLIENIKACGFRNIEITEIGQIIATRETGKCQIKKTA